MDILIISNKLGTVARNRGFLVAITFISCIAIFIRLKGLTFQSYWFDELYSVATTIPQNSLNDVITGSLNSVHPPLFHLLLWLWFKLFGFTELAGRVFPAILGAMCIPAVYLLGKELFKEEVGLYAATFATVNIFLLHYSQEVRPYSLYLLLSLISLLFFVRTLKAPSRPVFAGYILMTTALLYTHYFGFLIVAIEAFFFGIYILVNKTRARILIVFAVISAVMLAVMISPIISSIFADAGRESFWIKSPPPDFISGYFMKYFGDSLIVVVFLLALMIKGFVNGTEWQSGKTNIIGIPFIVLWLIIVLLVPYITSIIFLPVLLPRTSIIAVPAILYLASYGLSEIKQLSIKLLLFFGIIILCVTNIAYERDYYGKITKESYRFFVTKVLTNYPDVPVYSKRSTRTINAYSQMLGFDPRIQSVMTLKQHLEEGTASNCFIWVEGHVRLKEIMKNVNMSDFDNYDYQQIKKFKKKGIQARWFSKEGTSQSFCESKKSSDQ